MRCHLHSQSDADVYNLSTQFIYGDALLVAPVVNVDDDSRSKRDVYFPKIKHGLIFGQDPF